MKQKQSTNLGLKKFNRAKRQAIKLDQDSLVEISHLQPGKELPLLIKPALEGLNLLSWIQKNKDFIKRNISISGGILWRNFALKETEEFEQIIRELWGELLEYTYCSTPRSHVKGKIYTSTEYPSHQTIPLHNEMAYCPQYPHFIAFFCQESANVGGETPIADSRKVLKGIEPQIVAKFEEKQIMYVRNYGEELDLSWQNVFQTTDKSEVENYCRQQGIEFEWKSGDCLRTRQVCQAVATHPKTEEKVWFNQAHLFHISNLEPKVQELLLAEYSPEELPRNAYYGDGTPIESQVLAEIRQNYQQETIMFPWHRGDILMLDNMLTAHGRRPYIGQRQILVGMT